MTDILGIGSSGLTAYRKLLETTGNNIANANTEGYVRRDVVLQSVGEAPMLPTSKISASGSGVAIDLVRRASDAFLQSQVRTAMARESRAQILSDGLVRIEKSIVAPEHTIGTTVEDFFSKMQDLTLSPSSVAMRLTMIDAGQRVAERFRVTGSSIKAEIESAEAAIGTTIEGVNTITTQLAAINLEISRAGSGQQKLNDLLDQRDKLLKDLSRLATTTVSEKTTGEIAVYLGDSASGPQLVKFDESKDIGYAIDGDNVNFIYDPYGVGSITNQILGGALAGHNAFRSEALRLLEGINQLAVGLADAINTQHTQGIDRKGLQGKKLFSTDSVFAAPAALNRGSSRVDIAINTAGDLVGSKYTIRFNQDKGEWSIKSDETGASASGKGPLELEGLTFRFEGDPHDGDVFTAEPLKDAAIGLKFMVDDPTEIAASMPLYVDPDVKNAGAGQLNLKKWDSPVLPPTSPPAMTDLFGPTIGDRLSFRSDGNAFYVPSGAESVILSSTGTISAAHFSPENFIVKKGDNGGGAQLTVRSKGENKQIEASYTASYDGEASEWVVTSLQNGKTARGSNLITLDGNEFTFAGTPIDGDSFRIENFLATAKRVKTGIEFDLNISVPGASPKDITLTLDGPASSINDLVILINQALKDTGNDKLIFASASNGTVTLNGLRANNSATGNFEDVRINRAVFVGNDSDGYRLTREAVIESPQRAADLKVFTLEGKELFLSDMIGWRGIEMDRNHQPLKISSLEEPNNTIVIAATGEPLRDGFIRGVDGSLSAGGVYALDIKGMPGIRLAGEAIIGQDENGIAEALYQAILDQAPSRSWSGADIDFGNLNLDSAIFTIKVDGKDNIVRFTRSKDDDGLPLPTGSFEFDGPSELNISIQNDEANPQIGHIIFTLPKTMGPKPPQVSVSNGALLGFYNAPRSSLVGASIDPANITTGFELMIAQGNNAPAPVVISSIPGDDGAGLSWSFVNKRLVFESTSSSIAILPATAEQRENASLLGFYGTDLSANITEDKHGVKRVQLTSSILSDTNFANVDSSISRIGATVRFYEELPEDLIITLEALEGSSARSIATRFPDPTIRKEPSFGNITIKITDIAKSELEIIDSVSGNVVAKRSYVIGEPIQYLGLTFTLQSPLKNDDLYNIKWDTSRTGDNRNIVAMTQLQTSDMFGYRRGSFQDIYAGTAAKLGNTSQSAATDKSIAGKAASDLQSAYDSKTGVSLDKEASDLIRYQQAYQAAAQVVSVARTLFDTILRVF